MATAEEIAKMFKALCDPQRVDIMLHLRDHEKCACQLMAQFDMAQSKLAYHMKILCESGLVECWYVGKWTHYRINPRGIDKVENFMLFFR